MLWCNAFPKVLPYGNPCAGVPWAIAHLLASSIPPSHILYVSVDDPYLNRETLFKDIQDYFERFVAKQDLRDAKGTFYVFLDEVIAFGD